MKNEKLKIDIKKFLKDLYTRINYLETSNTKRKKKKILIKELTRLSVVVYKNWMEWKPSYNGDMLEEIKNFHKDMNIRIYKLKMSNRKKDKILRKELINISITVLYIILNHYRKNESTL